MNEIVGYWGERTATIDWCEDNYVTTHYIAEFWNTVSNVLMILAGIYGIYWFNKNNKIVSMKKESSSHKKYPFEVKICFIMLMMVGIGSTLFHMTLLSSMQLLDELPMLYGISTIVYANYSLLLSCHNLETQTPNDFLTYKLLKNKQLVLKVLISYSLVITCIYVFVWRNALFFQTSFGTMVILLIFFNVNAIRMLKLNKKLFYLIVFYSGFGFILWNIDYHSCSTLQSYRSGVDVLYTQGLVQYNGYIANFIANTLKAFSQFHALWHILAGYACFLQVILLIHAHHIKNILDENNLDILNVESDIILINKREKSPILSDNCGMFYHFDFDDDYVNESNKKMTLSQYVSVAMTP
jgi:dihydroceramidase